MNIALLSFVVVPFLRGIILSLALGFVSTELVAHRAQACISVASLSDSRFTTEAIDWAELKRKIIPFLLSIGISYSDVEDVFQILALWV